MAGHHIQAVASAIRTQRTASMHRVQARPTGSGGGLVGELVCAGYESPLRHAVVQPHVVVDLITIATPTEQDEGVGGRLCGCSGCGWVVGEGCGVQCKLCFGACIPWCGVGELGEGERLG